MSLLSQVIEAGKNDDLEDSKSICDDTDVEVASEVWIFSKKLFCMYHPCLQMSVCQPFTWSEERHFPYFYLSFLGVKRCWFLYVLLEVFTGVWEGDELIYSSSYLEKGQWKCSLSTFPQLAELSGHDAVGTQLFRIVLHCFSTKHLSNAQETCKLSKILCQV